MHLLVSLTSSMVCGRRLGRRTTEMRGHRPCRGSFLLGIISLIVSLGWTAALTSSNETLVCTARHGCGLRGICGSHTVSGTCLCVRDLLYTNYPKCYEPLSWVRSVKATVFFALRLVNREWRLLLRLLTSKMLVTCSAWASCWWFMGAMGCCMLLPVSISSRHCARSSKARRSPRSVTA